MAAGCKTGLKGGPAWVGLKPGLILGWTDAAKPEGKREGFRTSGIQYLRERREEGAWEATVTRHFEMRTAKRAAEKCPGAVEKRGGSVVERANAPFLRVSAIGGKLVTSCRSTVLRVSAMSGGDVRHALTGSNPSLQSREIRGKIEDV